MQVLSTIHTKNQTDLNQTDDSFILCSQEVVHIICFVVVHTKS